jgi:FixJ family two-component response regulator
LTSSPPVSVVDDDESIRESLASLFQLPGLRGLDVQGCAVARRAGMKQEILAATAGDPAGNSRRDSAPLRRRR